MKSSLKAGDRVRPLQVGQRGAFEGVISAEHPGSIEAFIVKDEDGRDWHRTPCELMLLPPVARAPLTVEQAEKI